MKPNEACEILRHQHAMLMSMANELKLGEFNKRSNDELLEWCVVSLELCAQIKLLYAHSLEQMATKIDFELTPIFEVENLKYPKECATMFSEPPFDKSFFLGISQSDEEDGG